MTNSEIVNKYMHKVINGKEIAKELRLEIARKTAQLSEISDKKPGLAVVLVGDNPASQVYVRNKGKAAKEVGFESYEYILPDNTSEQELLDLVTTLNQNSDIHGILVQLPLPDQINESIIIEAIDAQKDVDGFHPENIGKLVAGMPYMVPCTPLGCLKLLHKILGANGIAGKNTLIIGRSNIVGKPMANLMLANDATVTIAHSKTKNLPEIAKNADIIIAAVGRPEFVKGSWLKKDAVIIDVGINRIDIEDEQKSSTTQPKTKLVGDVDFESCAPIASYITPVPGGVGPMTIACLLENTLKSFESTLK